MKKNPSQKEPRMALNQRSRTTGAPEARMALVLSGGGVRGAYEAGVIHYLRTQIPEKHGGLKTFKIQCGSSVGAINTSFMAAMAHKPLEQGKKIHYLWEHLQPDNIYKRDMTAIGSLLGRTAKGLSSNLLKFGFERSSTSHEVHFRGVFDTSPLPKYLESIIPFKNIRDNLNQAIIDAVSITATNVSNGQMELFIEKRPNVKYTGEYNHHMTQLDSHHVVASAAIPVIFPAVKINHQYYIDGSLRLNTPMSPAIQLGAKKIFIIGLHRVYQAGEQHPHHLPPDAEPSLSQVVGKVMNSFFLDRIQYDVEQLTRINRLIEWAEKVYGNDFLEQINKMIKSQGIKGDIANRGLTKLNVFEISPSQYVSEIFRECYEETVKSKTYFTAFEKMLFRLFDVDPSQGFDTLSYLAFMPNYIKRLLELGYYDAKAHRDEIINFLMSD
jgi:NTE family protein